MDKRTAGVIATITEEASETESLQATAEASLRSSKGLDMMPRGSCYTAMLERNRGWFRLGIHECDQQAFDQLAAAEPDGYWKGEGGTQGVSILAQVTIFRADYTYSQKIPQPNI